MITQYDYTPRFEGKVPHIYKDSRGNLTAGIGFLLPNLSSLRVYDWSPNLSEAQADFLTVSDVEGVHVASFYRKFTHARLSEDHMRDVFERKVGEFRKQIQSFWSLNSHPPGVQIALVDMAFTLGAGGLSKYAKLHTACNSRDYATAALECGRGGVQPARNEATKQLFLEVV